MNDLMRDDPAVYWNEEAGPRWVAAQEALDRMMAPITEVLLDAAAPAAGEVAIDVGCGCGTTTVALAERVGSRGRVLGVDVSGPMLARAAERTVDAPVTLVHGDATSHDFEEARADLLLSRFGVMFFRDPPAAFANLRRALKPTGRLCFVAWQSPEQNPWIVSTVAALPEHAPTEPPPVDVPGPFGLATAERTSGLLEAAGFHHVTLTAKTQRLHMGDTPEEMTRMATQVGPLGRLLGSVSEDERAAMIQRVVRHLEDNWGTDRLRFDSSYWLIQATA